MIFAFFDWGWGIWDGGEEGEGMGEEGRGWEGMGGGLPAVFEEVALGA